MCALARGSGVRPLQTPLVSPLCPGRGALLQFIVSPLPSTAGSLSMPPAPSLGTVNTHKDARVNCTYSVREPGSPGAREPGNLGSWDPWPVCLLFPMPLGRHRGRQQCFEGKRAPDGFSGSGLGTWNVVICSGCTRGASLCGTHGKHK